MSVDYLAAHKHRLFCNHIPVFNRQLLACRCASAGGKDSPFPAGSLPVVARSLQQTKLLPPWAQWLLTHQPALFDRAFRRLFGSEIKTASLATQAGALSASAGAVEPSVAILERFWDRRAASRAAAPAGAGASSTAGGPPLSRYRSDFQELYKLGKGGFGLVVGAINRLDGRQYAVKKIRLEENTPGAFAKIVREVATLSRLQHPNVVRYFQVGCLPLHFAQQVPRTVHRQRASLGRQKDGTLQRVTKPSPSREP